MTGPRYINTGGGPYRGRANVPHNGNRRHYASTTNAARDYPAYDVATTAPLLHMFAAARQQIDALTGDTDQLHHAVTALETEVVRGNAADLTVVTRALRTIAGLVPELAAALSAGLLDPSAGVPDDIRAAARWALGDPEVRH